MTVVAQQFPVFQAAMRVIASITQAHVATVTTTFAHQYVDGQIIRFVIPRGFGMQQIDKMIAPITVTGDTTFTVPIDTSLFDPFATPSTKPLNEQYAQIIPIAELSGQLNAAVQNVLPYSAT